MKAFSVNTFILSMFIIVIVQAQDKNNSWIDSNGNVQCKNGIAISGKDLLNSRAISLPNLNYSSSIPSTCSNNVKEQIENLINSFKEEDKNNIQSIANNFCSHQEGWIEFNPGTCSAGGPPPICENGHWYKVSREQSLAVLARNQRRIASERANKVTQLQKQLESNICGCWVNEMKRNEEISSSETKSPFDTYLKDKEIPNSNIKFPCMGGCPDGFICREGFCVPILKNALDKSIGYAKDKVENAPEDYAKDKLQEEMLKNMGKFGSKVRAFGRYMSRYNLYYAVADAALTPTKIGGGNDEFTKKIMDINYTTEQLERLYGEYLRYKQGGNRVRDLSLIKDDIMKTRNALSLHLTMLYDSRREAGETCKGCCDQVIDYQVERVGKYVTQLNNFRID